MITLTLLALGLSRPVLACDCEFEPPTLPADGATDVPPNAGPVVRIMGEVAEAETITLSDGDETVPVILVTLPSDDEVFAILTPESGLTEGVTYMLNLPEYAARSFTVGGDADETAPDAPGLALEPYLLEDDGVSCYVGQSIRVTLTGDPDETFQWYEVELGQQPDLSDAVAYRSPDASFDIGDVGCRAGNFLDYASGIWYARAAAVDLAGNTSDWSETISVDTTAAVPGDSAGDSGASAKPADCGCASARPGGSVWAVVLLGLLGWRGRRSPSTTWLHHHIPVDCSRPPR